MPSVRRATPPRPRRARRPDLEVRLLLPREEEGEEGTMPERSWTLAWRVCWERGRGGGEDVGVDGEEGGGEDGGSYNLCCLRGCGWSCDDDDDVGGFSAPEGRSGSIAIVVSLWFSLLFCFVRCFWFLGWLVGRYLTYLSLPLFYFLDMIRKAASATTSMGR